MGGGNQGGRQEEGRREKAAVSSTYGEGRRLHQDTAGIRNDRSHREGAKKWFKKVQLEFRRRDSFGTLGGLGYDHTWSANSFTQWWTQRFAMTTTSHIAACMHGLSMHGRRASPKGPVELPALSPSRRINRQGKRNDPEPAFRPERAGSDGRPGAPARPRRQSHVRFAARESRLIY